MADANPNCAFTLPADMKSIDFIESFARSAAKNVGLLCRTRQFSSAQSIMINLPFIYVMGGQTCLM